MPELPEVERFRQTLLNLVSQESTLQVRSPSETPPRVWLSSEEVASIHDAYHCTDVLRKGKQLCMALQKSTTEKESTSSKKQQIFLFLHMGMTGSISTGKKICLGRGGKLYTEVEDDEEEETYPPRYAYLELECDGYKAAFCDPRKFGKCILEQDATTTLDELAPDAWLCSEEEKRDIVLPKLANQSMGIKGVLLDQKRACSGVGNWVADEVLYQCQMHPDQAYLTETQAEEVLEKLQEILRTAVDCLLKNVPYPNDWLFPYRWTKKKAGKDALGRSITFLKSGGRTSAIIASMQKLYKSQGKKKSSSVLSSTTQSAVGKEKNQKVTAASNGKAVSGRKRKAADRSQRTTKKAAAPSTVDNGNDNTRRRSPHFVSPRLK